MYIGSTAFVREWHVQNTKFYTRYENEMIAANTHIQKLIFPHYNIYIVYMCTNETSKKSFATMNSENLYKILDLEPTAEIHEGNL